MDSERRSAKTRRRGMTPDGRVALVAGDKVSRILVYPLDN